MDAEVSRGNSFDALLNLACGHSASFMGDGLSYNQSFLMGGYPSVGAPQAEVSAGNGLWNLAIAAPPAQEQMIPVPQEQPQLHSIRFVPFAKKPFFGTFE